MLDRLVLTPHVDEADNSSDVPSFKKPTLLSTTSMKGYRTKKRSVPSLKLGRTWWCIRVTQMSKARRNLWHRYVPQMNMNKRRKSWRGQIPQTQISQVSVAPTPGWKLTLIGNSELFFLSERDPADWIVASCTQNCKQKYSRTTKADG